MSDGSWWCRLRLALRSEAARLQREALQGADHPRWAARLIVWLAGPLVLALGHRSMAPAGAGHYVCQVHRGGPPRCRGVRLRLSLTEDSSTEDSSTEDSSREE